MTNPLALLISAVRRKKLRQIVPAGVEYLRGCYHEHEMRRFYRRGHEDNARFDRQHEVDTSAIQPDVLDVTSDSKHAVGGFQPVYESVYRQAFSHVRIDAAQYLFIDYGSGKGKAMLLASERPYKRLIGVEFSADLCRTARRNFAQFKPALGRPQDFEIVCADATQFMPPPEPAVFFFFNPFKGQIMRQTIANIVTSLARHPRPAWIVYINPDCASYFDEIGMFEPVAAGRRFRVWRIR